MGIDVDGVGRGGERDHFTGDWQRGDGSGRGARREAHERVPGTPVRRRVSGGAVSWRPLGPVPQVLDAVARIRSPSRTRPSAPGQLQCSRHAPIRLAEYELAQPCHRAGVLRLDCADGAAEDSRRLRLGQVIEIAKHEHGALPGG
jgi:hypothetical protein